MSLDSELFNVDSIQVLKGPQGTLFGRNTVAGAVQINTPQPGATSRGFVDASYGSYNAQKYQGYVTTGLTDRIAVDLGGSVSRGDGFITNIFTHDDHFAEYRNWTIRTGLKVDVSDALSFLFRYEHVDINDPQGNATNPLVADGQVLAFGAYLPGAVVTTRPHEISIPAKLEMHSKLDAYQLTGTWELGAGTLKSYSQYRSDNTPVLQNSYDFASIPVLKLGIPDLQNTITQELLFTSKSGTRLDWTVGAFYYDSSETYRNITQSLFGGPATFYASTGADDRSTAVYGDATYRLMDNLFLTGGVRYTRDQNRDAFWELVSGRTTLPTLTTNRVTPRAVIRYALNDESSVYASYSRGYKAAIYNTGAFSSVPIKPESISAAEIGYKFAAHDLSLDLSYFHYRYTNEQLSSQEFIDGVTQTIITNAASSTMYGVDASLDYRIVSGLSLNVGAEWLHARYQDFPNSPGFTLGADHLLASTTVDAGGFQMQRAPNFTASAGATYSSAVAKGVLALSSNVYYTSKFYFDTSGQLPQDSYTTLGVRAAWTSPGERYEIAVGGNNVTNEKYHSAAWQIIFGAGGVWAPPATYYGSIHVKFL
jgi:iron complex outermembrane receptor protein